MAPLIVLVTSFAVLMTAGRFGVRPLKNWVTSLRWALLMFLLTASAHFGSQRPDLIQMVPQVFPNPELLVTLTGVAEIAGAIGLVIPRFAPLAAGALALLLVALFPANVHAARAGLTIGGEPVTPLVPRTFMQLGFIAALLAAGFAPRWPARAHGPRHSAA
jgi:uncharacterized membrane protein